MFSQKNKAQWQNKQHGLGSTDPNPGILPVTITHTVRYFHLTDINYKNTSFTYFSAY